MKDLHKQNISLLVKWWWKLDMGEGLWQEVVRAKYLKNSSVASVKPKFTDYPVWKSLLKVKDIYMAGRRIVIKSGNIARVWLDPIGSHPPLCDLYPDLFSVTNFPNDTIAQFKSRAGGGMFRRRLNADLTRQLEGVQGAVDNIINYDDGDGVEWSFGPKGRFTTKSVYSYLEKDLAGCDYRWIWRAKLPVKI